MESYWKILLIFAIYWQVIIILKQNGILEKYHITNHGPLLMIRTTRGLKFLEWIARTKVFWKVFADIGISLMLIGMFLMFGLIIFSDITIIAQIQQQTLAPPSQILEARNIFLIPGINEFIPLLWGMIGLIVTLVVHEFSHAILCRVEDIRVKSMGIMMVVFPIGGFAEPDEEQLFGTKDGGQKSKVMEPEIKEQKQANRRQRVRILSAGVMANFVTALIAFALFFIVIGNIAPVSNVMITDVVPNSPADIAGLTDMTLITHVNDKKIENASQFYSYVDNLHPDEKIKLKTKKDHTYREVVITPNQTLNGILSGVRIEKITPGMPSEKAGLMPGMLIVGIDNVTISNSAEFMQFMSNTIPGQEIQIHTLVANEVINYSVILTNHPMGESNGYIGITSSTAIVSPSIGVSVGEFMAKELLHILQMIPSLMLTGIFGWVLLMVLPFPNPFIGSFQGFSGTLAIFYEPIGWAASLGEGVFWIANTLLWIGWLNFYVGLFNCLPMLPLDGGHVFKDIIHSVLEKLFGKSERMGEIAGKIATSFALLILASIVFMILAPYVAQG
ncbi:MAG: PDZ domain-containing protein [Nitrospirae bacterium]|nr:PDZ domain-containing protein [Nitrospirota bacterium]